MTEKCAAALKAEFSYVPDEDAGEKWVVYRDNVLLVFHPERLIRVYKRHALGTNDYHEIDPTPWL